MLRANRWSSAEPSQPVIPSRLDVEEDEEEEENRKTPSLPMVANASINGPVKRWLASNDYATIGAGCKTTSNIWDQFYNSDLSHETDKSGGSKKKIIQAVKDKDITILTGERGDRALATGVMAAKFGAAYSRSANFKKVDRFVVIVEDKESALVTRRRLLDIFPETIISVFVPGLLDGVYVTTDNEISPFHPDTDGLIVLPETAMEMMRYDKGVVGSYIIEASDRHLDDESIPNFLHSIVEEMTADDRHPVSRHLGRLIIMTKRLRSRQEQWEDQKERLETRRGIKVAHATLYDYMMTVNDSTEDDTPRPYKSPPQKRRREGYCLMRGEPHYTRGRWWMLFDRLGAAPEPSSSRSSSRRREDTETSDVSTAREPEEYGNESDDDIQIIDKD